MRYLFRFLVIKPKPKRTTVQSSQTACGDSRTRTGSLLLAKQSLYHWSYIPMHTRLPKLKGLGTRGGYDRHICRQSVVAPPPGFEPELSD
jgi:hypothetical protein